MDKICIVKRRRQVKQSEGNNAVLENEKTISLFENNINTNNYEKFLEKRIVEEFNDDSGHVVSITMTEEQTKMLQTSEYIKERLNGIKRDPALNITKNNDGHLILNFHLNESPTMRMLRINQVCEMLQVSRSLLMRLIHENKIKSYKVGRLRRFLFEDILEYLLNNEELVTLKR
jgi:excisionase family DNA binding protein